MKGLICILFQHQWEIVHFAPWDEWRANRLPTEPPPPPKPVPPSSGRYGVELDHWYSETGVQFLQCRRCSTRLARHVYERPALTREQYWERDGVLTPPGHFLSTQHNVGGENAGDQ